MQRVVTLTMNPAIDKNTSVDQVVPDSKLRCTAPRREPGGGGLNVARAIDRLGGTSTALYTAGGPTGDILAHLLEMEGVEHRPLRIEAWTRENLIVSEEHSAQQFRFGMPGPALREAEWQHVLQRMAGLDPSPDYLVASGSLPPGAPDDFYDRVAAVAAEQGTRVVVDTSGEALRQAVQGHVYLVKPNVRELQQLVGRELTNEQEQGAAAQRIIADGRCEVIVLSLGAAGARLITADDSLHFRTPTVPIRSRVGAGDSIVGGIVLGLARGFDLPDAVRYGVAAGAAAVMTPGTELCRREDTAWIYEQMNRAAAVHG